MGIDKRHGNGARCGRDRFKLPVSREENIKFTVNSHVHRAGNTTHTHTHTRTLKSPVLEGSSLVATPHQNMMHTVRGADRGYMRELCRCRIVYSLHCMYLDGGGDTFRLYPGPSRSSQRACPMAHLGLGVG